MTTITGRTLGAAACAVMVGAAALMAAGRQAASPPPLTITLTGQSMLRSDLRATAPKAVPVIAGLLTGDVVFTNFEGAVALPGQAVNEGRGFLAPPEALKYVAIHELCHLKYRDHSPRFWGLVGSLYPDWRDQRDWLKTRGHALKAELARLVGH